MKKKIMEQWVAALRSGEFKQAPAWLENDGHYCCLGVLSVLAMCEGVCGYEDKNGKGAFDGNEGYLTESVKKWSGIKSYTGVIGEAQSLARLNDEGTPFPEIADIIEKNWRKL